MMLNFYKSPEKYIKPLKKLIPIELYKKYPNAFSIQKPDVFFSQTI